MKASRAFSVGAAVGALCSAAATWGLPAPQGLGSPTRFPPTPLGKGPRGGRRPRDGEGGRSSAGEGGAPRLAPHLKELQAPAPVEAQNPRPG